MTRRVTCSPSCQRSRGPGTVPLIVIASSARPSIATGVWPISRSNRRPESSRIPLFARRSVEAARPLRAQAGTRGPSALAAPSTPAERSRRRRVKRCRSSLTILSSEQARYHSATSGVCENTSLGLGASPRFSSPTQSGRPLALGVRRATNGTSLGGRLLGPTRQSNQSRPSKLLKNLQPGGKSWTTTTNQTETTDASSR